MPPGRHYHQRGLLPEPARLANGYREYTLTDVVVLARIRRLTELGLTLGEVRDALGDARDLREILLELDADLAEEERRLRARRARLAALLDRVDLHVDDTVTRTCSRCWASWAARPPHSRNRNGSCSPSSTRLPIQLTGIAP